MGSRYNVLMEWETGERSYIPRYRPSTKDGVYNTDPVTVAIYAREHGLLDEPGWQLPGLKKYAKTEQRLLRHANQAKLHSFRTKPMYMYGVLVPRNYQQALDIDASEGNTLWA